MKYESFHSKLFSIISLVNMKHNNIKNKWKTEIERTFCQNEVIRIDETKKSLCIWRALIQFTTVCGATHWKSNYNETDCGFCGMVFIFNSAFKWTYRLRVKWFWNNNYFSSMVKQTTQFRSCNNIKFILILICCCWKNFHSPYMIL